MDRNNVLTDPKKLVRVELKNVGFDIDKIKIPDRVYLLADDIFDEMVSRNVGEYRYPLGGKLYVFNKNELTTTKAFEQVNKVAECKCETIEVNNCVDKNTTNESTNNETTKININTDSKEKLMTISGIGPSKADAIIEYRTKNGNFKTTEDIINVSGISKTIYDKIKDTITV